MNLIGRFLRWQEFIMICRQMIAIQCNDPMDERVFVLEKVADRKIAEWQGMIPRDTIKGMIP